MPDFRHVGGVRVSEVIATRIAGLIGTWRIDSTLLRCNAAKHCRRCNAVLLSAPSTEQRITHEQRAVNETTTKQRVGIA